MYSNFFLSFKKTHHTNTDTHTHTETGEYSMVAFSKSPTITKISDSYIFIANVYHAAGLCLLGVDGIPYIIIGDYRVIGHVYLFVCYSHRCPVTILFLSRLFVIVTGTR